MCECTAVEVVEEPHSERVEPVHLVVGGNSSTAATAQQNGALSQETRDGFDWLVDSILENWDTLQAQLAVERLQNPFSELVPSDPIPLWRRETMFSRASSVGASFTANSWRILSGRKRSASVGDRSSMRRRSSGVSRATKDADQEGGRGHPQERASTSPVRRNSDVLSQVSRTSRAQSVTFQNFSSPAASLGGTFACSASSNISRISIDSRRRSTDSRRKSSESKRRICPGAFPPYYCSV